MRLPKLYSPRKRALLKSIFFFCLILLLASASTIPFFWESKSLWYKFGMDKTILQLGKIAGLLAAIFLFAQILLALRIQLLDKVFGLDRIYFLHQINGYIIVVLAILHASLVILPEGMDNLPIGWKFWPEILGATVFILLFLLVFSAKIKERIMPYHLWRMIHRPMGYLIVIGISIHIFYVSDSFEYTVPKYGLVLLITFVSLLFLWSKYKDIRQSRLVWKVDEIKHVNSRVVSIRITPPPSFTYAPGQFAFLKFSGKDMLTEPHPFTLASAPAKEEKLRFLIKKSGDWTSEIDQRSQGKPSIQGPFGLFSYTAKPDTQHIILIAAGIGITPMLSMLRQIASESYHPDILLVWGLRFKKEMFLEKELREIADDLESLKTHIAYSQEAGGSRITRELLRNLLHSYPKTSHIYLCGPEQMMKSTRKALVSLGFMGKHIYWERFAL